MRALPTTFGFGRSAVFLCLFGFSAAAGSAQVVWLADASNAKIDSKAVTGQVKGKPFTLRFGRLAKTGGITLGDAFDHYTVTLQDADTGYHSNYSVDLTLTVPRGTLPDSKTFRRIPSANLADQPGPGKKERGTLALAEFYSFSIRYRPAPGQVMNWISPGPDRLFTGKLELDKRKGDRIGARLYVCFDDPDNSCAAGTAQLEIR